ncbi:lipooligosaccharide transport system ATP-binding protein [Bradyrhizobium elkanii]
MRVGVVPQFDNLELEFTVRENLLVFGRYFGLSARKVETIVPSLLEFARLESKANVRVAHLSGGMKRRLTLARALINDPHLLVMDEPTTGLDPHARHLIWERLRVLLARGKTILLTTHFMEEAERLCDRLCVLKSGRKIAEGKPNALIDEHIGCDVIEIYGGDPHELGEWLKPYTRNIEVSGETLFCYAPYPEQVRVQLRGRAGLRILQRPPNLEDVFLRLTGREMEK